MNSCIDAFPFIIFFRNFHSPDFIDTGNYKKALAEADKVLKKQKDFSCAKVLKSLALLRLNRTSDAETVLDEVRSTNPTEDATLQAMTTYYRDTHQPMKIVEMYEKAIAKDPINEELYSHLFMSYVRVGDYVKQQRTAQNLYKLKPINPYYFWSVVSSYLQAVDASTPPETRSLLLKLSEKKVEKLISEGKIEQEAEVELYLMILEAQEKYEHMIRVMEGPLGKFIRNVPFLTHRKAQLHQKLRQNEAAFHLLQSLLDSNPDQLPYYLSLISLAIELDSERSEARHLLHVLDVLNNQIARNAKSKVRAPYLAKIELVFQVINSQDVLKFDILSFISLIGRVDKLIDELFTEFGHKMPFYSDLGYIECKYPQFREDCEKWLQQLNSPLKSYDYTITSEDEMKRHFSLLLLDHHVNPCHRTVESMSKLIKLYSRNLKYGKDLPSSDINPSDFYALIGISCVIENLLQHKEDTITLIALCYKLKEKSPSNHTIKFILIFLLNSIGAGSLALQVFNSLETKYIQVDTLDYVISRSLGSLGQIQLSLDHNEQANKFYSRTCRDTNDFTFSCYKFGSFGKISEINQLRTRIKYSLQHLVTRVDLIICRLMLENAGKELQITKVFNDLKETLATFPSLEELIDNRDLRTFGVLPLHLQYQLDQWKVDSFPVDCLWYDIRHKLIGFILCFYNLSQELSGSNSQAKSFFLIKSVHFKSLLDQFQELLKKSVIIVNQCTNELKMKPYTSRLITFTRASYGDVLLTLINELLHYASVKYEKENTTQQGDSIQKPSADCKLNTNGSPDASSFTCGIHQLNQCFQSIVDKGNHIDVQNVSSILEELVNFTETITFITTYIWIVSPTMKSQAATTGGRRKKKSTSESSSPCLLSNFISDFQDILKKSLNHIKNLSIRDEQPKNRLTSFIVDTIDVCEVSLCKKRNKFIQVDLLILLSHFFSFFYPPVAFRLMSGEMLDNLGGNRSLK